MQDLPIRKGFGEMCVAYPGKVLSITAQHAKVDFTGNIVDVNISMVPVTVGDYVLVHAGMAIQKVDRDEGKAWQDLFKEIQEEAGKQ